jgi:hypothetical protein
LESAPTAERRMATPTSAAVTGSTARNTGSNGVVGTNLFSSWREEDEAEQRRIYNEIGLGEFKELGLEQVHPYSETSDVRRCR